MAGNRYLATHNIFAPVLTRRTLLILALIAFTGTLYARTAHRPAPQAYRMHGFNGAARTSILVSDKQTEDPLIGATVSIVSRADTLRGTTAKADFYRVAAIYRCDQIFRDSVDLEVTYVGYKPYKKRFAATEFRGLIRAEMEVDEQSIAQVVVVGKQIAMVFKGDTTVYNAGAFKTMADDRLEELLRQLPGVEIRENQIYADGEPVKRVLIDGKNLFGSKTQYALTDLVASDVKNVRVYEDLSPEAKRLGKTTDRKEKVMDVETKSKRGILEGGELEGTIGASLEKDYSGRHEIRHSESGTYYRNSEKGNWRLSASNSKDDGQKENASFNSKITPSKQTDARAEYTYRRGDSTNVMTSADFSRSRQSSINSSRTEYFPTDDYALRSEENNGESRSKSLTARIMNMTSIQRKRNVFSSFANLSFRNGSSSGRSRTIRRIDDDITRTHLNSDSENRSLDLSLDLNYYITLSKRSTLSMRVSGKYGTSEQEGWRIDTLASTPGLQVRLRNDGDGRQYTANASVDYAYKLGEKGRLSASYTLGRDYDRSKQLSVDFLDDPAGVVDTVNSYDYTTDNYSHALQVGASYSREKVMLSAFVSGTIFRIARNELFPNRKRFPRQFYQLNPSIYLSLGKSKRRFNFNLSSYPQMISTESLRSTLDATNPLALRAGNPDLKLQNNLSGSTGFSFYDAAKALNLGIRFNAGYTFNYVTTRRTLFLENTYLDQWDYTAQKGAQLTTQTNVGGCYSLGGSFNYAQQISSLRSTINAGVNYSFNQTPYYLSEELDYQVRHALRIGVGFNSGFSTKIKIAVYSNTTMSSNTSQQTRRQDLREQLSGRVDLRLGKYFASVGTLYEFYCNSQSRELTRHNVILNASAGRKFGKENRLGCSVGVIDILNRPDYATTSFETDYIVTSSTSYLGRYGYLRMTYTF